ncbi:MAG: DNA repair protein RecN [Bacteroidetes bacterium HGW-Bacteroidetes-17]|jgi:DNA repair protein RecN (Recombination protein N)|nr:MAG: DNA repair protein RecN [Bacteroidetes bacterium HGW-Bacteroidetes-17]
MLQNLLIENYALIKKLDIGFSQGFSVITGETGAGKSIMLGALSLILGSRADTQVLQDKSMKCIIEGKFLISSYNLEPFFEANDLDYEDQTILRREISPAGKSRAFVNDTPVNLPVLKELGDRLVNIHSQHAIVTLNDANFQLAVLDSYVGHEDLVLSYKNQFKQYKKLQAHLEELKSIEQKSKSDFDYFQFQFEELDNANLVADEQQELEATLEIQIHAEEIKSALVHAGNTIDEAESNVLDSLNEVKNNLYRVAKYHSVLQQLAERINANIIDLKDINAEISGINNEVHIDAGAIESTQMRLDLIYRLEQKHHVTSVSELVEIKHQLYDKLDSINFIELEIARLQRQIDEDFNNLSKTAKKISDSRNETIAAIEHKIVGMLQLLGMPNARFSIMNTQSDEPGIDGFDRVRYFFNANKGSDLNEVAKIASGGELSRLMLSIKSLISGKKLLPTIVFDEIDKGVSGEVAAKVGNILAEMSNGIQLIVITHLPQIAGKGDHHYRVTKESDETQTHSHIKLLNPDERVMEIAKMISGDKVSEVAMQNAKILLS